MISVFIPQIEVNSEDVKDGKKNSTTEKATASTGSQGKVQVYIDYTKLVSLKLHLSLIISSKLKELLFKHGLIISFSGLYCWLAIAQKERRKERKNR
jgi:hypothetical protein